MASVNHTIYVSSDEDNSDWFDGDLETSDEKPKVSLHRNSNSSEDADDDEDCVVLDGDPYKTTTKETANDTCDTNDEVLVVGQKGEIACRDFPHPRHACAKYPFDSTSHEKYCDMCHCYVCDIRAPCPYWCIGISSIDHCHANYKEQIWKNRRECIRTGEIVPRHASTIAQLQQLSKSQSLTRCSTHPNTYSRPVYRTLQNPGLQQPCAGRIPSRDGIHNIAQGSLNRRFTPPAALQGNPQRIVTRSKVYGRQSRRNMYSPSVQTISAVPSETPNPTANQQQQQAVRSNDRLLAEFEDWLMDDTTPTGPNCPLSGQDNATTYIRFRNLS